jgi:hypothetical protein
MISGIYSIPFWGDFLFKSGSGFANIDACKTKIKPKFYKPNKA